MRYAFIIIQLNTLKFFINQLSQDNFKNILCKLNALKIKIMYLVFLINYENLQYAIRLNKIYHFLGHIIFFYQKQNGKSCHRQFLKTQLFMYQYLLNGCSDGLYYRLIYFQQHPRFLPIQENHTILSLFLSCLLFQKDQCTSCTCLLSALFGFCNQIQQTLLCQYHQAKDTLSLTYHHYFLSGINNNLYKESNALIIIQELQNVCVQQLYFLSFFLLQQSYLQTNHSQKQLKLFTLHSSYQILKQLNQIYYFLANCYQLFLLFQLLCFQYQIHKKEALRLDRLQLKYFNRRNHQKHELHLQEKHEQINQHLVQLWVFVLFQLIFQQLHAEGIQFLQNLSKL
ncbi:hypothetical protein TTHERM_000498209 (macronuclear) [Tetrahymena thermophila SB210]|uniref:Uncharacterized protein n=1 Tax=Tetrahymena thermophila (strain SB210) TaxID=312017 RepID=W7X3G6_TETTS|nr:hypothetical protein TTHERM_000498209 [Tetrahymena thermophila SB210]EWS70968.1 hypothetical protein TTHERM_000498209 [Tetrahymena thermophila SB210]|eukprot:XP_012656524.1 hypothetical protein TTHERM_000498209 [Tetrahymena thermophila SB210]